MATFSQSTIGKESDMVQDFLCSTCEDKKLNKTADFYCESCVKFYCGKCIGMHSELFTIHAPFGRGDMKKWPVAKKVEDFLRKCDAHEDENLQMFCGNHSKLCCTNCAFLDHRQCKMLTLISDKGESHCRELHQLEVSTHYFLAELKKLQDNQEAIIRSELSLYDEQLHTIQETRREINAALDRIEQKTLNEMKDTLTKLQASTKSDVDKCIRLRDELKELQDAIQDISGKNDLELSFIATMKCKDKIKQSETFLKKNSLQVKVSITFQPNSEIERYLSKLSGLGRIEHSTQPFMLQKNPNKEFILLMKHLKNMSISRDISEYCNIIAICVLSESQVLVADMDNRKIKLLDQQYQVVSHWCSSALLWDMCKITPSEVAVTVYYSMNHINEVQFITVDNWQLITGRKIQLQHNCRGIACHQGDLYITDHRALYKYTLSGKLVSKMYEDTSDYLTGIVKTHNLAFIECETLQAVFAKDMCPNSLTAASKLLCDAVMNFQNTQEEITLIVSPQKIVLKNYVEDEPDPNKVMHTNLSLEPEEFDNVQVGLDTEVTFCLKELRAILAFSEVTTLPLTLNFETAGRPIVFTIDSDSTFEGNFVLATLADQQTQSQAATHARASTQKRPAGRANTSKAPKTTLNTAGPSNSGDRDLNHTRSSEQTKRLQQEASAYEMLNDDTDFDEMIQNDTTLLDQPSVEALRVAPSGSEDRTMWTSVRPGPSAVGDNRTTVSRDSSPIVQSSNKSEESPVIPVPLMNLRVTLGDDTFTEDPVEDEEEEAIPGTPPAKRFRSLFFGSSQVSQTQNYQPSVVVSKVLAEDTDDED